MEGNMSRFNKLVVKVGRSEIFNDQYTVDIHVTVDGKTSVYNVYINNDDFASKFDQIMDAVK